MMFWLLYLVPKKMLSRGVGWFVHLPLPKVIALPLMRWFANRYKIDLNEAEKPLDQYRSIGDLFIRKLKPGLRPLGDADLVHPADSRLTQKGSLEEGTLVQAKGKTYSLVEFLGPLSADPYFGGQFVTYYLCPTDYHRVHSPVTGLITKVVHLPGALWPVNEWSTQSIPNLFSINERVVVEIETPQGKIAVVFVGATNVGQMSLSFWPEFRAQSIRQSQVWSRDFSPGQEIKKGDELGIFHMGSTIVECLSPALVPTGWDQIPLGRQVRVRANWNSFLT